MGHLFRIKLSVGRNKFRISIELNHSACLYSGNEYNDYITKYASSSHALKSQNRKVLLVVTIRYPLIFYKQHVFIAAPTDGNVAAISVPLTLLRSDQMTAKWLDDI